MAIRRLVADIGGTNARFAIAYDGKVGEISRVKVADHPSLEEALDAYFAHIPEPDRPTEAVIDVAGPVNGDMISLTNLDWSFSVAALKSRFGFTHLRVFNDFAATAMSVPYLTSCDLSDIGPSLPGATGTIGIIGPGTGLGVGALVYSDGRWIPLPGEGGHVTIATVNEREDAIASVLRKRWSHLSAERLLSGVGLVNIYTAICKLQGVTAQEVRPSDVTERATAKQDPLCEEAFAHFCNMLGTTAANLAVTIYATGGIYIAGGILPRFRDAFAASGFRARFEDKGRFEPLMKSIPTRLVMADTPALTGLANADL